MVARAFLLVALVGAVALASACPSEVAAGCRGAKCDAGPQLPPRFYADPPFGIGFDCVVVGCAQEKHVIVENRGGGKLMVSLTRLSTDTSTDFTLRRADGVELPNPDNQLTLAGGETVELIVTYLPSDGRPDEGAIVFEHYDGAVPYIEAAPRTDEIPVTTRTLGSPVAALASGDVLDFGYVALGESKTLNIQVRNDGTDAVLRVGPTSAEDGSPAVFAPPTAGDWGEDFANPADVVEIPVSYTPTAAEASFGAVLIQTNDGAVPALRVALQGTAIATPRLAIIDPDDGTLTLAGTRVGVERNGTITVRNLGGQPLDVATAITAGAEQGLSITEPAAITALAPLATTTFTVHLLNEVGGAIAGSALFTSNDPDAAAGVTVAIVGEVAAPVLAAEPATLQFGDIVVNWTAAPQQFAISNTGYGDLEVTAIGLELGSSQQIRLIDLPPLPQKLAPGDAPLVVTVLVQASNVGPADGVVLVTSDSITGDTGRVDVRAQVVTCEQGCPTPNGTPDCSTGSCEVGSCVALWHDANLSQPDGCECGEDVVGAVRDDIGQACGQGLSLGEISDDSGGYNFSATLHDLDDVDLYFFRARDDTQFLNDDYGAQVSLLSAPPGLQICANFQQWGAGCGGTPINCSSSRVRGNGQSGIFGSSDNSEDVTVWLMWAQGANPVCGSYTFRYEADEDF
ncbi:MAG: choice-of-anchor D domain-containing protein [Deltaproteobacteria bacterium]|nr:choice-of-anchor D domain-containing protein [Deltaproteobacteria bacterium]